MKCKFYFSVLLLFLSVLCSPAPTVNFSAPPFNPAQFLVDQVHNNISILGSSNTISSGVYPIKIFNLTGTNYFSIDSTGVPSGYILLTTNNTVAYFPFSGGTGGSGTLTNVVFTNAGPSDTYVIGNTSYLITNSFSGGGSAGTIYNFNTNDFLTTLQTNISLSLNVPRTNQSNIFYPSQNFRSGITIGTSGQAVINGNGSGGFANSSFTWTASGDVTAISFTGNGSGLTALNAGNLSSGTVPAARLPLATTSAFGAVKPDGTTILVSGGVISAVGSSSTITNLAAGQGLNLTNTGGTNIFSMAQQQYDTASLAPTNALATNDTLPRIVGQILTVPTNYDALGAAQAATNAPNIVKTNDLIYLAAFTNCVFTNTGTVPFFAGHTLFIPTNSFTGGGGNVNSNYVFNLNGFGTNETFWGTTTLTNSSGNGITFDGTTFLLNGVNLNTGPGGTIGGIGSGLVQLNASGISSGTLATARMGSGTPQSTNVLHGNGTWAQVNVLDMNTNGSQSGWIPTSTNNTVLWEPLPTSAGGTVTNNFINPLVATNTGPFVFLSIYGTGSLANHNEADFSFDTTNLVIGIAGDYAGTGTHTNYHAIIPLNGATNTMSTIFPTNVGTIYTNGLNRSTIQGALNLTTAVGNSATADIFWTNSGVAHFEELTVPLGAAFTYKLSISGIQLDPLATFKVAQAAGTIIATNLWLNQN